MLWCLPVLFCSVSFEDRPIMFFWKITAIDPSSFLREGFVIPFLVFFMYWGQCNKLSIDWLLIFLWRHSSMSNILITFLLQCRELHIEALKFISLWVFCTIKSYTGNNKKQVLILNTLVRFSGILFSPQFWG